MSTNKGNKHDCWTQRDGEARLAYLLTVKNNGKGADALARLPVFVTSAGMIPACPLSGGPGT